MDLFAKCLRAAGLVAIAALAFSGTAAAAEISFCEFGSGTGQCEKPAGVAVDRSNGRVYVVDRGNNRVNVFDSSGGFLLAFGGPGSGSGQLSNPRAIAVDNDPASTAFHDVYVVDDNLRVQRFAPTGSFVLMFGGDVNETAVAEGGTAAERNVCTALSGDTCGAGAGGSEGGRLNRGEDPVAIGLGGVVFVGDSRRVVGDEFSSRIEKFEPSGSFIGSSALPGTKPVGSIAVDSSGDAYITIAGGIEKFEPSEPNATFLYSLDPGSNTTSLAIDSSDNLFAAQSEGGFRVITEYDSSGSTVFRFGYREIDFNLNGLAVSSAGNGVFGSEEYVGAPSPGNRVVLFSLPPPGPLACCPAAGPVGNTKATLNASINPEGKETKYHFEYIDQAGFEAGGFSNPATESSPEAVAGSDFALHSVSAQANVEPETTYHFRVVASNELGTSIASGEFESQPPLQIGDIWSTAVGADAAQLHAAVNPLGLLATGYFEYVDDATFQVTGFENATRLPNVSGGATPIDFGSSEVEETRFAQLSSLESDTVYHYRIVVFDPFTSGEGIASPERVFRTFPPPLPSAPCPNATLRTGSSANLPDCRAYEMVSPVDKNNSDIAVFFSNLSFPAGLDQSSTDGNKLTYSSVTAFGDAVSAPFTSQYIATRKEGEGWFTHAISPPRGTPSFADSATAKLDVEFKAFSSDPALSSGWLLHDTDPTLDSCAVPGFLNLYRRDNAGEAYEALTTAKPLNQAPGSYWPELQGVSADGSHAVFRANAKLNGPAASITDYQLYEHVRGKGCGELRLVSVLPNGTPSVSSSSAGTINGLAEGRENTVARAVSEDGSRIYWTSAGALYLRVGGKETVQVAASSSRFWTAATDGSKAIYTIGEDLYEFDADVKASTLIAKGVAGIADASRDASRLYFVSREALTGEAKAGEPNLYLREEGMPLRLVATLAPADVTSNFRHSAFSVISESPVKRGARATPDGGHLVFVSTASLTGYDNKDAENGQPAIELYLYDGDTDTLACVSCNHSGGRPTGREFKGSNGEVRRVAAQLPVWENQLYVPRALSDSGNRIFFESFEALVLRDTNGRQDVYEWERAGGKGECEEKGAELYVQSTGGCLSLISSGESPIDAQFTDASPNGNDVFIKTDSSLLSHDPGQVDIYDARVEGGLPIPPEAKAECEGGACQTPPTPPGHPTPSSSVFQERLKPFRCPKGKRKIRRAGKVRCVPKHKHHRARHRDRKNHHAEARR